MIDVSNDAGKSRDRLPTPLALATYLIGALALVIIFTPIVTMFARILFPGGHLNVDVFAKAFANQGLRTAFENSLIIIVAVNLVAVPIGVVFAWLNFRTDAKMGALTNLLPILPLLLPSVAMTIGWVFLGSDQSGFLSNAVLDLLAFFGSHTTTLPLSIFSWEGLLLLYVIEVTPVIYVIMAASFRSLDSSLEEAARINGSGVFKTFVTVSVPAVRHAILLSAMLVSVLTMGIYSIPAIIGTPANIITVSVYFVRLLQAQFPPEYDQATVMSLVLIFIFGAMWLAQRRFNALARHAQIGGRGLKSSPVRLGRSARLLARAAMLSYIVIGSILPIIALLLVTLQPFWTLPNIDFGMLTLSNFQSVFQDRQAQLAIENSFIFGIISSFVTLSIAAFLMIYAVKVGGKGGAAAGIVTKMPAAISQLVIAAGLLIAFGGPPFHLAQSALILVMAYVIIYMPQASIAAEAAARQVSPELSEASRICGSSEGRTLIKIMLPLMLPGLAAGWALIFAHVVGELTASVILAGPQNPVLGYLIMSIFQSGTYSQLAVLATIIAVMSALTVGLAFGLTRPKFTNSRARPAIRAS